MIGLEPLRWVLTVTFAATCGFHLVRCARPAVLREPIGEHRISEALHLIMGVSMVAAFWWFSRGLRLGNFATASVQRPLSWPAICHGLMSIGMGLAVPAMA